MCLIQRTNEWTLRLENELNYHKEACFLTLTYSDENLPVDGSLNPKHFIDAIKRFRSRIGKKKIKYFGCGEYGEATKRPHYHAIIFGWKPDLNDCDLLYNGATSRFWQEIWPYGFNQIGSCTHDSIQYVVGYVRKKLRGPLALEEYGFRVRPFMRCSKGLGLRYALDNKDSIIEQLTVNLKGKNRGLPRYYAKKLGLEEDPRLKLKSAEKWADLMEKTDNLNSEERKEVFMKNLKQGELNNEALLHLRQARRGRRADL